jgi:Ankyrin repeats (many copies)
VDQPEPVDRFIVAASAPRSAHASGTLDEADALLAAEPGVAGNIYAAAILGDAARVRELLAEDAPRATAPGGPYEWDALTYLCFSRYLRLRGSDEFVDAAEALLDAGADAGTGFYEPDHQPAPTFESALYGAAGVAHHAGLTRLLLARGADPNAGGEVGYHAPEGFDNGAMMAVVESGRLDASGLLTMLHRKLDWTDLDGVRWLLEHGADPNAVSAWGDRALHHSLARGNQLPLLEALLDAGADPSLGNPRHRDLSAHAIAARMGRVDALDLFARRGFAPALDGDDAFYEALARADASPARALMPARLDFDVVAILAGTGNAPALSLALDLGLPLSEDALPTAVWRKRTDAVRVLLTRGAPVTADVRSLAERAQTEVSEWTPHRSREILDLLDGVS